MRIPLHSAAEGRTPGTLRYAPTGEPPPQGAMKPLFRRLDFYCPPMGENQGALFCVVWRLDSNQGLFAISCCEKIWKKEADSRFAHFRYQVTAKTGESDIRGGKVPLGVPDDTQ